MMFCVFDFCLLSHLAYYYYSEVNLYPISTYEKLIGGVWEKNLIYLQYLPLAL
jgi:hypothetical protein